MLKILFSMLAVALMVNCASVPDTARSPEKGTFPLDGKSVATITVNNYSTDIKDTTLLNTGVAASIKSAKILPTLPDAIKDLPAKIISEVSGYDLSKDDVKFGGNIDDVLKVVQKAGAFDLLLMANFKPVSIDVVLLGFYKVSTFPGVMCESVLYDIKQKKFISRAAYPKKILKKEVDLPAAGTFGVDTLQGK